MVALSWRLLAALVPQPLPVDMADPHGVVVEVAVFFLRQLVLVWALVQELVSF